MRLYVQTPNRHKYGSIFRETLTPQEESDTINTRVRKNYRFTVATAEHLAEMRTRTGLTETALISMLINGYRPRERPTPLLLKYIQVFSSIANNLNQLSVRANSYGYVDEQKLSDELLALRQFREDFYKEILAPDIRK